MKTNKKLLSLLLAFVLILSFAAGCKGRDQGASETDPSLGESSPEPVAAEPLPDLLPDIAEKKELNEDSVGWLVVPNTEISDVVLYRADSNDYYLRRNFNKDYEFNGVYFADRRSTFGSGSREELGLNTCIYGHAMTDDPTSSSYPIKFGPLHNFRDEDFAKETPYLFFSTETENMAFEIFAVFIANSNNTDIPYNRNDLEPAVFHKMIQDEVLPRSIYDYDVELKEGDKILTLSTCIYNLPDGGVTGYPKTFYRFAIMARLVDENVPLKAEASFTVNEDALLEPDTYPK